jgi:DNA topoisomerase-2
MSTDTEVDITLKLVPGVMQNLLPKKADYGCNQLEKALGMYTTRTTTNMNLFDSKQRLKKFTTVYEIIEAYFTVRYNLYIKRKEHQIRLLEYQLVKLSNKARFIHEQIVEPPTLVLRKKKKQEVIALLKSKNYDVIDKDKDYKYLRTMTIDSLEEENVAKLLKDKGNKEADLNILKIKTIEQMWLEELDAFSRQYNIYRNARIKRASGKTIKKKVRKPRKKLIKIKK